MLNFKANDAERLHHKYDISLNDGVLTVVQYGNPTKVSYSINERIHYTSNPHNGEIYLSDEVFEDAMDFLCRVDTIKFHQLLNELRETPRLAGYCVIAERVHWLVAASIYNLGL